MANKKLKKIRITSGIAYSKTRSKWFCSWCEKEIKKGEETILIQGIERYGIDKFSNKIGGARIHLDCIEPMCESIKTLKDDRDKYAILNSLDLNNASLS